jgi:hypothetical protein
MVLSLKLIGLLPCLLSAEPRTFGVVEKSHLGQRGTGIAAGGSFDAPRTSLPTRAALAPCKEPMRLDPAQQIFRHLLGVEYFVAGHYETAVTVFRDRIARAPKTDSSRALIKLAVISIW